MGDFSMLIARYNASLPTLTDGHVVGLQVDVNGRLLVQADVSVLIDAMGLNGAGDTSNIMVVGTEDGTGTGTKHVLKVASDGQLITKIGDGSEFFQVAEVGDAPKKGIQALAYKDSTGNLVLPQLNAAGEIKVSTTAGATGTEAYNATDDLAAAGDGLVVITAAATPFVTAYTKAVPAGNTLYIYGYEWCCDQNADAQLITDDGTDVKVYKRSLNSSAVPTVGFMWSENARIEIVGSATMNVKLQIKKRSATGGNANGSASVHSRLV